MAAKTWTEADVPDQSGRVAVVTGANSGLGFDTARTLAEHGATVVVAVRDDARGEAAADRIRAATPGADVRVQPLDLASLAAIRTGAEALRSAFPRIDLLINNAGVMVPPKRLTEDGFELQFGTNHLGHFALTGLLLDRLLATAGSRVVVVASLGHRVGRIRFEDLQSERRYRRLAAYGQSKLANLLFCYALQRRLAAAGASTVAVAAHPGYTDSDLVRYVPQPAQALMHLLPSGIGQDPRIGALPQLRAATDPAVRGGQYWGPNGIAELSGYPTLVRSNPRSHDEAAQERLWRVSTELTGVSYPV